MSAGPLVASGIGIFLLVVVAYVLIGGTLATAEVMVEAQSNLAANQETRMRTAITIQNTSLDDGDPVVDPTLYVEVKNTGSEPIVDLPAIDVYLQSRDGPAYVLRNRVNIVSITPDDIHPGQLDPGETLNLSIGCTEDIPIWVQVVTPNGVSSSAYINAEVNDEWQ